MKQFISFVLTTMILGGCSLEHPYSRPELAIPIAYKEPITWVPTQEMYSTKNREPWWEIYEDTPLSILEEKLTRSNQSLKAAFARYQQAHALVAAARSDYFPQVTGTASGQHFKNSATIANTAPVKNFNDFQPAATVSYEADVWGRIGNLVAAAEGRASASAADLAAMDLSLHTDLAINYFALRGNDQSQQILDEMIKVYKKALFLIRKRYEGGAAPEADVDQMETQLKTVETTATNLKLQRSQLEHAVAVLIGEAPSTFSIPVEYNKMKPISIDPSVPSSLLERRPDIAAAEHHMKAANADVGVVNAAYFPNFMLLGTIGYESQFLSKLIQMPSLFWSIGPSAALKLFDGGRIEAFAKQAEASYFETISNYRQTVLVAFREVEDNLVAIHRLTQEMQSQTEAIQAANRSLKHANYRCKGGIATYLDVVGTHITALQAELSNINIKTQYQIASVQLIKAIGGGWQPKPVS